MYEPVQKCNQCGAGLSLDDMRRDGCPYCSTVYPHRSQAAQHQQVVHQVLGAMVAQQAQPYWSQTPGGGPPGMVPPPGVYGDPQALARVQMAHVQQVSNRITKWVVGSIIASFVLVGISIVLVFAML